jgi:cyclopropane-fatty-acyl-phospholipid synthase
MSDRHAAVESPLGTGTMRRRGSVARPSHAWPTDRHLLYLIQSALGRAPIELRLWNGWSAYREAAEPVAVVTFLTRSSLVRLLWNPNLYFGEAYMAGELSVTGDLVLMLEAIYENTARDTVPHRLVRRPWLTWNTVPRSRHNVHHHYDLGNDFYAQWLDRELLYTCAYFQAPDMTLEAAQIAKMDYVCRKLRLQPGERVVEAGCGWGALALHMARQYGVEVTAYNLSHEQVAYARARAAREGLEGRVTFVEDDYRAIDGVYDAVVSVGMLEHVGPTNYRTLGGLVRRILAPGHGRALLHFIGRTSPKPLNAWIRRRIFPGAHPPSLAEVTAHLTEPWDLTIVDVENLRRHYTLTLEHWLARFEASSERVAREFDPAFVRAWRLYLAGSVAAFKVGSLQLFQIVLTRDRDDALPSTREDVYRDWTPGAPG